MSRIVLLTFLLCVIVSPSYASDYSVTILDGAKATCINNSGQIGGRDVGPCTWDLSGARTLLSIPAPSTTGSAYAINDSGRVAGFYFKYMGGRVAAYWNSSTSEVDLGAPTAVGECYGVNSSGAMCGTLNGMAVVFSVSGVSSSLCGTLGSPVSGGAMDINDAGQAVGYVGDQYAGQVAIWNADGTMRYLGSTGQAKATNNSGVVGGKSDSSPFLWTSAGGLTTLTVASGYTGGEVNGLNDQGEAVGSLFVPYSYGVPNGMSVAALWATDGSLTILPNPTGYTWATALGINEAGQIVGSAYKQDQFGLYQTAVLWSPVAVPEPSCILGLICGLSGLTFWRKRR